MDWQDFKRTILSDLYRYRGQTSLGYLLRQLIWRPGFRYIFVLRLCQFMRGKSMWIPLYILVRLLHRHLTFKYGIQIQPTTAIGEGFYIGHFGCIVVSRRAVIGANCNISQGVTIGQASRGKREGYPVIGDRVYIAPGAKIIGSITIGNDVAIGANCVVVDDVPDNAVVVGIPGKVVSMKGSKGYVDNVRPSV
jgi:serine O-acetyltransferase